MDVLTVVFENNLYDWELRSKIISLNKEYNQKFKHNLFTGLMIRINSQLVRSIDPTDERWMRQHHFIDWRGDHKLHRLIPLPVGEAEMPAYTKITPLETPLLIDTDDLKTVFNLDLIFKPVATNHTLPHLQRVIDWVFNNQEFISELRTKINKERFMICGGFVANIFFNHVNSVSDIDVWHNDVTHTRQSGLIRDIKIDLVGDIHSFDKVLTNFDLSCCSIGIVFDKERISLLYTSGIIYTALTRKIVVNYSERELAYVSVRSSSTAVLLRELYFRNHNWLIPRCRPEDVYMEWMDRIAKYVPRVKAKQIIISISTASWV